MTVSFIGAGYPEYPEKTTDPPQITDKLDHLKLYRVHLPKETSQTHNCVERGKSNCGTETQQKCKKCNLFFSINNV